MTQSGAMAAAQGAKVWQSCAALMRKFQEELGNSYGKRLCYSGQEVKQQMEKSI